jgi:hypothetical protein
MLRKKMTFTDVLGNVHEDEEFCFNFFEHELMDKNLRKANVGGMEAVIEKIMATNDTEELMDLFCWIIDGSYGVPTLKGGFMKSPEILAEFKSTQAYSDLYMELATDTDAALAFLKGIMPADIASKITDGKVQNMDDLRAMVQDHKAPQK